MPYTQSREATYLMDYTEEFPFDQFPWKLVHKDGKETRKCYFDNEYNRQKHIDRYKLKKKDIQLSYKFEESK